MLLYINLIHIKGARFLLLGEDFWELQNFRDREKLKEELHGCFEGFFFFSNGGSYFHAWLNFCIYVIYVAHLLYGIIL